MNDSSVASVAAPAIRIGVAGACGRMGKAVIAAAAADSSFRIALAFMPAGDPSVGEVIAADVPPIANENALQSADIQALIDFTRPGATLRFADVCAKRGIGMIIGTTGFSDAEKSELRRAAQSVPIFAAQNMSVGVNVMYELASAAARRLKAGRLGGGYDMEISEAHHRNKKDAPSGTALRLGQALASVTGGDFSADAVLGRRGRDNPPRNESDIGFSVVRGGDIVGEHRVIFAGAGEQLEIIHRASSRANYAAGALRAAKFIAAAKPGFYENLPSLG